ncbi:MAG: beta-ketoacyl-ACP synthase III [Acidimicrobiia bacterium]
MRNVEITGWGKCMPPNVLSNHDLEQLVDTSDDWITARTGIKERRISHVEASELAAVAGLRALAAAGKSVEDVDLLLVATCSGDSIIPSTASVVQKRMEAWNAAAIDLNAACSGFVYGLVIGANMIRGGTHRTVLLIGTEKLHHLLDFTDRSTCILFGDGAGAVVLEGSDGEVGVLASDLGMDGAAGHVLEVPIDGTMGDRVHPDPAMCGISMEGQEIFRRAVTKMGESSLTSLDKAGLGLEDVDLLIPHQANSRIIDATARRLGLDGAKVYVNIQSYGNTSAATIPVALTEALEDGRISPGDIILFTAFGGGLTWASLVYKWGSRVTPLGESDAALPPPDRNTLELLQPNFDFFGLPEKMT